MGEIFELTVHPIVLYVRCQLRWFTPSSKQLIPPPPAATTPAQSTPRPPPLPAAASSRGWNKSIQKNFPFSNFLRRRRREQKKSCKTTQLHFFLSTTLYVSRVQGFRRVVQLQLHGGRPDLSGTILAHLMFYFFFKALDAKFQTSRTFLFSTSSSSRRTSNQPPAAARDR